MSLLLRAMDSASNWEHTLVNVRKCFDNMGMFPKLDIWRKLV